MIGWSGTSTAPTGLLISAAPWLRRIRLVAYTVTMSSAETALKPIDLSKCRMRR